MRIRIWGARGSAPSPLRPSAVAEKIARAIWQMPAVDTTDWEAVRAYVETLSPLRRGTAGGNTSCVEITSGETTLIIDAGSGLRDLGRALMDGPCGRGEGELTLLFSHAHWDHIQGFPFFAPAFVAGNRLRILSVHNIERSLKQQQNERNFPVRWEQLAATISFERLRYHDVYTIGSLHLRAHPNRHPGDAYAYRIEADGSAFVYAHDGEYDALNPAEQQPHLDFFEGADVLLFDAQYTLSDSWIHDAWGHSSAEIGVEIARAAGVRRLLLSHHDPTYTDEQLEQMLADARAYQAQNPTLPSCEIDIAREGLEINLTHQAEHEAPAA